MYLLKYLLLNGPSAIVFTWDWSRAGHYKRSALCILDTLFFDFWIALSKEGGEKFLVDLYPGSLIGGGGGGYPDILCPVWSGERMKKKKKNFFHIYLTHANEK